MPWNPDQYHKFQAQRAAPFEDLLRLISVRENLRVIDLGCGTGELTARLADALPGSEVLGVDSSAQMLAKAQPHERRGLRFEQADIATIEGEWDLVFSHAAIQWVDDHAALIPHLWRLVAPGGQIAIQQPANHDHPSHVFAHQIASEEPFRTSLSGWVRTVPVLPMDRYAKMLFDLGAEDMTVLEKIYPHVLENADSIAEWTSGTLLVPYFERLGDLRESFMQEYRARLRETFPDSPVFYPFRRMLFAAHRAS